MSRNVEHLGIEIRNQTNNVENERRNKEELCAEDWHHQEDERTQEGVHENRY